MNLFDLVSFFKDIYGIATCLPSYIFTMALKISFPKALQSSFNIWADETDFEYKPNEF